MLVLQISTVGHMTDRMLGGNHVRKQRVLDSWRKRGTGILKMGGLARNMCPMRG